MGVNVFDRELVIAWEPDIRNEKKCFFPTTALFFSTKKNIFVTVEHIVLSFHVLLHVKTMEAAYPKTFVPAHKAGAEADVATRYVTLRLFANMVAFVGHNQTNVIAHTQLFCGPVPAVRHV